VQISSTGAQAIAKEEFRNSRNGQPPGEHCIGWAISGSVNL
jgi:hypothetical protein